jgi:hypothetical protein
MVKPSRWRLCGRHLAISMLQYLTAVYSVITVYYILHGGYICSETVILNPGRAKIVMISRVMIVSLWS